MGLYGGARRYYHRKRMNARWVGDAELEGHWRYKQEHVLPAVTLPASFPLVSELAAMGYTTYEDLVGADRDELQRVAELTPREADEVIAAVERAITYVHVDGEYPVWVYV